LIFRAIQEPFTKQWLSSSFSRLKSYNEFKKTFTELLWNPCHQASIRSLVCLDIYNPNSRESYLDQYIKYAHLASTLNPPMTQMDLLSTLVSRFEPRVQHGLICGNFQNTQDALAFLAKYQVLGENRDSFRSPRQDYDRRGASRVSQNDPQRDDRQRDHGNNVNMKNIRRQTDRPMWLERRWLTSQ
jgi:hypothetical protein